MFETYSTGWALFSLNILAVHNFYVSRCLFIARNWKQYIVFSVMKRLTTLPCHKKNCGTLTPWGTTVPYCLRFPIWFTQHNGWSAGRGEKFADYPCEFLWANLPVMQVLLSGKLISLSLFLCLSALTLAMQTINHVCLHVFPDTLNQSWLQSLYVLSPWSQAHIRKSKAYLAAVPCYAHTHTYRLSVCSWGGPPPRLLHSPPSRVASKPFSKCPLPATFLFSKSSRGLPPPESTVNPPTQLLIWKLLPERKQAPTPPLFPPPELLTGLSGKVTKSLQPRLPLSTCRLSDGRSSGAFLSSSASQRQAQVHLTLIDLCHYHALANPLLSTRFCQPSVCWKRRGAVRKREDRSGQLQRNERKGTG